jgi:hypothetical protein
MMNLHQWRDAGESFSEGTARGRKGETRPLMAVRQCSLCNRIIRPSGGEREERERGSGWDMEGAQEGLVWGRQ